MKIFKECNLAQLVSELINGKTVVFPTETSYGLGCDATNQEAVDKIFQIKGRKSDKPLLVVVPSVAMAKKYLVWNELLEKIARKYWPSFARPGRTSEGKPGAVTVVGERLQPILSSRPLPCGGAEATTTPPPQGRGEGEDSQTSRAERSFSLERVASYVKTLTLRRDLRKNQTKAEKILWSQIRAKRFFGLKFNRQHGIGPFIADFFHPESRTVIEIDGDVHFAIEEQEKKDRSREQWLISNGYRVIRFNNVDIFNNLDGVLEDIHRTVTTANPLLPSSPLRWSGGNDHPSTAGEGRGGGLATGVVSANNTIAIRVTAHPLLKSITEKMGRPLVATSANIADAGDIYSSADVIKIFAKQKIQPDIILDLGNFPKIPPTTIVDVTAGKLKILRSGKIKVEL